VGFVVRGNPPTNGEAETVRANAARTQQRVLQGRVTVAARCRSSECAQACAGVRMRGVRSSAYGSTRAGSRYGGA